MIKLIDVIKKYKTKAGEVNALDGVSLEFGDSGMIFVTGKSGSGKTTMLNVVGGLDGIDDGEIEIFGKKFSEFTQSEYDSYRNTFVGFIFQEYNLLPDFTVKKNIQIANELQGVEVDEKRIDELLEEVGIGGLGGRMPSELSGGQKQRVAIARALIKNPKIIMADEPTGALDSQTGIQVMNTLRELSKNKLILIVSHDLELAEKYADRIIRIVDGKVVEDISVSDQEIVGNIYEEDDKLTIKSGANLNAHETEILLKAIREKKQLATANRLYDKSKKGAGSKKSSGEQVAPKFIKSKMKFKSAAFLGLKSLTVKPLRLAFTVFLSVIAFAVFGLFDTIASYNSTRVMNNLLKTADYGYIALEKSYTIDSDNPIGDYSAQKVKFTQESIDELNKQTGYNFRGVYPIDDSYLSRANQSYQITDPKISATTKGQFYYLKDFNGLVEFKNSELTVVTDNFDGVISKRVTGINANGFNIKVLYGTYPTLTHNNGAIQDGSLKNVAISSYMAENIKYWMNLNGLKIGDKEVTDISQLVNFDIKVGTFSYKIACILDLNDIPEKYEKLKRINIAKEEQALYDDYRTFIFSNLYCTLIVPEGYIACKRAQNISTTAYYATSLVEPRVRYDLSNKGDSLVSENSTYSTFYNAKDFTYYPMSSEKREQSQVLFFSNFDKDLYNNRNTLTLAENEALIHISDFIQLFSEENIYACKKVVEGDLNPGLGLENKVNNELRPFFKSAESCTTIGQRQGFEEKFKELLQIYLRAQEEVPILSQTFNANAYGTANWFNQSGLVKNIEMTFVDVNEKTKLATKQIKIVGIYMSVNKSVPYSKPTNPLVLSTECLQALGINTDQGEFGRVISPLKSSAINGASVLADKMTIENGVHYSWFQNSILSTIEENSVMIKQFADLFLYAALVLALFSVFMLFNYISTSIVSKRQTIGVLRALGSGGKDVFRMFMTESLIISVVNGILATIVSYLGTIIVNFYVREIMNLAINFAIFGIRQIIVIFVLSVLAGIFSSLLPILKIASVKPVKLIREP